MQLTDEQKQSVATWVADGDDLSEIQNRIVSEFSIAMTYMDVRFLVDDLGAVLKDKAPVAHTPDLSLSSDDTTSDQSLAPVTDNSTTGIPSGSTIAVEVDRVTKPGASVSGTVIFTDGVHAAWAVDALGRLALTANTPDYNPSADDLKAFQEQLVEQLRTRGF